MKRAFLIILIALGLAGCKSQSPTVDPFFGLHGFYISEQRPYAFDYLHRRIILGKDTFALWSAEFKQTDLDLFLTAGAFYRFFRLKIDIQLKQLAAELTTEDKLPIAAEREREEHLQIAEAQKKNHTFYSLLSARQKPLSAAE